MPERERGREGLRRDRERKVKDNDRERGLTRERGVEIL